MAKLIVFDPDSPGEGGSRTVGLQQLFTTIGRGKANAVVLLGDSQASFRHASIQRTADGYTLRDEASTNGTWVNGQRVEELVLRDGDEVLVGETVMLFQTGRARTT